MSYLRGLKYYLPSQTLSNDDLVRLNPTWNADEILAKTGIANRRIAGPGETAGDLGFSAAELLLSDVTQGRRDVDALLFCTQSPDYVLPTTACILQARLKLPDSCAAFDYNLGCSGFTYGLWLADSLIESGAARNVLLVVADTYSKYCYRHDRTTVTLFGDGAAAALVCAEDHSALAAVGPTVLGTDGRGAEHLIVPGGGARNPKIARTDEICCDEEGQERAGEHLFMNGPEVFAFALSRVRPGIQKLLDKIGADWEEIDLFLLHQANRFLLEQLRRTMRIPADKMPIDLEDCGNTVGASIPILLCRCLANGTIGSGHRCVLAGFGVGYSWAMTFLEFRQV